MEVYAGLDLHATNTYVAMIDAENKVLYKQRHSNDVPSILSALDPFREDIEGVVVESTFNWYCLVDALMDHGYRVHLANVSAIKQYEGLKQISSVLRVPIEITGHKNSLQPAHEHFNCPSRPFVNRNKMEAVLIWNKILSET